MPKYTKDIPGSQASCAVLYTTLTAIPPVPLNLAAPTPTFVAGVQVKTLLAGVVVVLITRADQI